MKKCLWCDGELDRIVPTVALSNAIRTVWPEVMAVACKKCHLEVLVMQKFPHTLVGTVKYTPLVNGNLHFQAFFAMDGELIVGHEIQLS